MTDIDREAKWLARAQEWQRLAGLSSDEHIAGVCMGMAEQAQQMAKFWRKWR